MVSWLSRRRARIDRIDSEAEALVNDFGEEAYFEARRRGQEASSDAIAEDWRRVAFAVAHRLATRIDLDPTRRMAMNAVLVADREEGAWASLPLIRSFGPEDEPKRTLSPRPQPFRIEFLGATPERGSTILKEVQIRAADVSDAIIAAANAVWPPRTIGLRILDREGREVFARQKAERQ